MKDYFILKKLCKVIFRIGSGNYWYEENEIGNDRSMLYKLYAAVIFTTYGLVTLLEIMAAVFGNFPSDEKRDAVTFATSHTIVLIKLFSVISNRKLIQKLNCDLVHVSKLYEEENLMTEKYRIIKINVIAYIVIVYVTAACFVYEGFRKMREGSHFSTVVTYYPAFEDNSVFATAFRFFTTFVLFVMMVTMILSVDAFTLITLIIYKYKIIILRKYFEKIAEEFKANSQHGNLKQAAERLTNSFVEGIKIHNELIRKGVHRYLLTCKTSPYLIRNLIRTNGADSEISLLSNEIDKAFGTVMALQVCQSSGSAVSLLLQMALSDQLTLVARMKIVFFVAALFFLLGLFLCNAGEITYQASLLSDAIFYCGWYECPVAGRSARNLRSLVLQACAQAQRPIVMKAFKMIELTYATFLWVVRGTYSVFALIYAQNQ